MIYTDLGEFEGGQLFVIDDDYMWITHTGDGDYRCNTVRGALFFMRTPRWYTEARRRDCPR
jgi:hypothetical protein